MGDGRKAAEGEKKPPEKLLHKHPHEHEEAHAGSDKPLHPLDPKVLDKTPPSLIEAASKELVDQACSGRFKRLTGELLKGVLDLGTGAEDLLKSALHSKQPDGTSPDLAGTEAVRSPQIFLPANDRQMSAENSFVKTDGQIITTNTFTPVPNNGAVIENIVPVVIASNPGDQIVPNVAPVVTKPDQAVASALTLPSDKAVAFGLNDIKAHPVKTISISGPPPGYTEANTFQLGSSFVGPNPNQFTLDSTPGFQPGVGMGTVDSAPHITILQVHNIDPAIALLGAQPAASDSISRYTPGACDLASASAQPLNFSSFQQALNQDNSRTFTNPATTDNTAGSTNVAQSTASDTAAAKLCAVAPGSTPQSFTIADIQNLGGNTGNPTNPNPRPADTAMTSAMFSPIPIAQQNFPLGSTDTRPAAGTSSATTPASRQDAMCAVAPGSTPQHFTIADIQSLGSTNPNPNPRPADTAMTNAMFSPVPIAQQRFPLGSTDTPASGGPATTPGGTNRDTTASRQDALCAVPPGSTPQHFTIADIQKLGDANTNQRPADSNTVFNPTPLASQKPNLGDNPNPNTDPGSDSSRRTQSDRTTASGREPARSGDGPVDRGGVDRGGTIAGPPARAPIDGPTRLASESPGRVGENLIGRGGPDTPRAIAPESGGLGRTVNEPSAIHAVGLGELHPIKGELALSKGEGIPAQKTEGLLHSAEIVAEHKAVIELPRQESTRTMPSDPAKLEGIKPSIEGQKTQPDAAKAPAELLQKGPELVPSKKLLESDLQPFRYVGVAPSAPASESGSVQRPFDLAFLANTLARASQPTNIVSSLDLIAGGKNGSQTAAASGARADVITGPVSLASLTGRATVGDISSLSAAAGNAASTIRGSGTGAVDAAIANSLVVGKGIFAIDTAAVAGKPVLAGDAPLTAAGKPIPGLAPGQAITALPGTGALTGSPAIVRPGIPGSPGTPIIVGGRTLAIDPMTGRLTAYSGETGRAIDHNYLAELNRIQKPTEEKRYLTGVEIAIAAALASSAIAKSRNTQNQTTPPLAEGAGTDAAKQLKSLLDGAATSNEDASTTQADEHNQNPSLFKRPTYMIAHNDSLVEIAERLFHNSDVAWLIADINAGRISEHEEDGKRIIELRSRQEIELPHAAEVEQFLLAKAKEAKADHMVTIVSVTEIDRELLDSFLSTVVGAENSANAREQLSALPAVELAPDGKTNVNSEKLSKAALAEAKAQESSKDPKGPMPPPPAAPQPLMQLVDFGKNFGMGLMPTMTALLNKGRNIQTFISKIDMVPSRVMGRPLEPELQR